MHICTQSGGLVEHIGLEKGYAAIDWSSLDDTLSGNRIQNLTYEGICIFEKSMNEVLAHFEEELSVIRKYGLTISQTHAPFPAYVPGHPEVLDFMIGIYKGMIQLCDRIDCKNLIIHGISLPINEKVDTFETIDQLNMRLYESLIPTLLDCNVTVCLENLFTWNVRAIEGTCSDPYEAVRYLDTLNAKAGKEVFGLCLDTGHAQLLGKDMRRYIPILGKRIKCLHIHDNDGTADKHLAPMTGKIDWAAFSDSLREIGYDGDLSFETYAQTQAALQFGEEMVQPWLNLIAETGRCFRDRIQRTDN